jgi:hypothetical protein
MARKRFKQQVAEPKVPPTPVARPRYVPEKAPSITLESEEVVDSTFWYAYTMIEHKAQYPAIDSRMIAAKIPAQYSEAPSGCRCYRVARRHKDLLIALSSAGEACGGEVPYALPGITGKQHLQLVAKNEMAYLYREWTSLAPNRRRRND